MQQGKRRLIIILSTICFCFYCPMPLSAAQNTIIKIFHEKGLLSVEAENVQPEILFSELGRQCDIEVIAHGDVFPEKGITVSFKDLPEKEAIKKLVKLCGFRNYLLDFQGNKPEETRLVKLELFMPGSGERVLTKPAAIGQGVPFGKIVKPRPAKDDRIAPIVNETIGSGKLQDKDSFAPGNDFHWDGSGLIDFPKYTGTLAYDKSTSRWDDDAKLFSQKTMDIIPPAVRDAMADAMIKACDEVAKEKGTDTITPEIAADAVERLAKGFNMPPVVMQNLPKSLTDFDRPKTPIDPKHLKEQYRK